MGQIVLTESKCELDLAFTMSTISLTKMCRGAATESFSEERETTTYLKEAQVQNRLYNREPVQLL